MQLDCQSRVVGLPRLQLHADHEYQRLRNSGLIKRCCTAGPVQATPVLLHRGHT
jgi:hypothetical protein